jgi:hypothetical protein
MKPHRWSRIAILTLIGLLKLSISFAQPALPALPVTLGEFSSFPVRYQLYPRIITNDGQPDVAEVLIAGTIIDQNITGVRIVVDRDLNNNGNYNDTGEFFDSEDQPLVFANGSASFSITINQVAELANYRYRFYSLIGGTPSLLTTVTEVVAGDIYIIQGQSNAEAQLRGGADNPNIETNRNFIRTYGNGNDNYAAVDKTWGVGRFDANIFQSHNIGQVAGSFAARIINTFNIPVAVFNGAYGGASIDYFFRNNADPKNLGTNYGRLLTRISDYNFENKIRGIIWYQGETNAAPPSNVAFHRTTASYIADFNSLKASWLTDFASIEKIYIVQTKTCALLSTYLDARWIQEAHRQLAASDDLTDDKIDLISTTNVPQYTDDCHYGYVNGYQEIGRRVFNAVARDLYDPSRATLKNTYTPQPVAASFSSLSSPGEPSEISIELNYPGDDMAIEGSSAQLINNFRLASSNPTDAYTINSVQLSNSGTVSSPIWQIKVSFNKQSGTIINPSRISYIIPGGAPSPAIANDGGTGIGLAAFNDFPIADGVLPVDPMQLSVSRMGKQNRLKWTVENNDQFEYFEVERSASRSNFKSIATIEGSGNSGLVRYEADDKLPFAAGNFYRIKGVDINGRVEYSQVVVVTSNRVISEGVIVFPNPVTTYVNATIAVKDAGPAELLLHNSSGQLVSSRKIMLQENNNSISLGELLDHRPGMYILTVVTAGKRYITKIIKTQ